MECCTITPLQECDRSACHATAGTGYPREKLYRTPYPRHGKYRVDQNDRDDQRQAAF